MKINLEDFFKHYNPDLKHHKEAVLWLEENLPSEFLEDTSEWVRLYRNRKEEEEPKEILLPVPFYPQTDNYALADTTCNSSACAMCLEYFKPGTLYGPKGDDEYLKKVLSIGASEDHTVQTKALLSYGVKSSFHYNLGFLDLDEQLKKGRPVVIGILHKGSLDNPTGGHMIVVIGKNDKGQYICNDPYGDLYDGYTGAVIKGKGVIYEARVLEARWTVEGLDSGWGRLFHEDPPESENPRETIKKTQASTTVVLAVKSPESESISSKSSKDSTTSEPTGWFMPILTLVLGAFRLLLAGERREEETEDPSISETKSQEKKQTPSSKNN